MQFNISPDWIQAIAAIVSTIVSIVLLRQLGLARDQLSQARQQHELNLRWNRRSAAFQFVQAERYLDLEAKAAAALLPIGIPLHDIIEVLTDAQVDAIWTNGDARLALRNYLNLLEDHAAAVHADVVDDDCAYSLLGSAIIRHGTVFKPFIERFRRERNDDHEIYHEIEQLGLSWATRYAKQRSSRELALQKVQEEARRAEADANRLIASNTGIRRVGGT